MIAGLVSIVLPGPGTTIRGDLLGILMQAVLEKGVAARVVVGMAQQPWLFIRAVRVDWTC